MNPKAHRTLLPSEVRYAWPPQGSSMSSRMAVTVWLDVLRLGYGHGTDAATLWGQFALIRIGCQELLHLLRL
jgi:hypothetical protein